MPFNHELYSYFNIVRANLSILKDFRWSGRLLEAVFFLLFISPLDKKCLLSEILLALLSNSCSLFFTAPPEFIFSINYDWTVLEWHLS